MVDIYARPSTSLSQEVTSGANVSPSATPCEPIPR